MWTQDERTWARHALASTVTAEVRLDGFVLEQEVIDGQRTAHRGVIATDLPREALYFRHLGKLARQRDGHLVYTARGVAKTGARITLLYGEDARVVIVEPETGTLEVAGTTSGYDDNGY